MYWRLWWAAAVDNVGDGAFATAVPLLASAITRDPRLISLVSAAGYAPWLLVSIPAGVLVDRRDRVSLMWRSQASQAVIVAVVTVLVLVSKAGLVTLILMGFALGVCEVVFSNASQAMLPDLVSDDQLPKANSSQYTVTVVGQVFVGPPVGSLLYTVSAALPFGVNVGSFALSAGLLAKLPRRPVANKNKTPVFAAMKDGMRWLGKHRLLRALALVVGVNTFCFQMGNAILVLLAQETLHVTTRDYGFMLASAAVGGVLGGIVNTGVARRVGPVRTLMISLVANVLIFEGIGLTRNGIVVTALLALNGFANSFWSVGALNIRQRLTPAELMGRVNSVYRMLSFGLMPFGAAAGGFIGHEFGLGAVYPIAGAARGVALLAVLPVLVGVMRSEFRTR